MKKVTKLLLATIVLLMLATLFLSTSVQAVVYVTTPEEFQTKYEEFIEYDENNPDDDTSYRLEPALINGKNTYDFIEIEYENESQKELFDYTFEDGTITVQIKDSDLYNALEERKFTIDSSDELFEKLKKYVDEENSYIGVKVKLYYTEDISEISVMHIQDNGVRMLEQYETPESDEYFIKTDEKGTYMELLYGGTLADYWSDDEMQIGARSLGFTTNSWNNAEFLIRGFTSEDDAALTGEAYERARKDGNFSKTCTEYAIINFKYELAETTSEDEETGISVTTKKDNDTKLIVSEIDENDADYKELAEKLKELNILSAYNVELNGDYTGSILVSFPVGEEHNGKVATILHKKSDGTIESFEKQIANGKVEIVVEELSPFMIAIDKDVEEESDTALGNNNNENNNNKENENNEIAQEEENADESNKNEETEKEDTPDRELDETPKTGVVDFVSVAIAVVAVSVLGLAFIIKRN